MVVCHLSCHINRDTSIRPFFPPQDALFAFEIYGTECSIKHVDVDSERRAVSIGYIDFRIVGPNRLQVSGRIYQVGVTLFL
jgi:hypothetical protein